MAVKKEKRIMDKEAKTKKRKVQSNTEKEKEVGNRKSTKKQRKPTTRVKESATKKNAVKSETKKRKVQSNAKKEKEVGKHKSTKKQRKPTIKVKKIATKKSAVKSETKESLPQIFSENYIHDNIEKYHTLPDFKYLKKIHFDISGSYDFHKLGLLVVDPYWIYAYWEIKSEVREQLIKKYGSEIINNDRLFLVIYDITNVNFTGGNANSVLEIKVNNFKGNWFINTNKPNSSFIAKLGFKEYNNNFIEVLCSNIIKTPRDRESENFEQIWATLDIEKPISLEMKEIQKKYLKYKIRPEFLSSFFGSIFGSRAFFKKK